MAGQADTRARNEWLSRIVDAKTEIVAELPALLDTIEALARDKGRLRWQPIETAPKDGRDVLLYFPLDGLSDRHAKTVIAYWSESPLMGPRWTFQMRAARAYSDAYQPTHWMPLPDAPALTSGSSPGVDRGAK
jgi:hypothetical protein